MKEEKKKKNAAEKTTEKPAEVEMNSQSRLCVEDTSERPHTNTYAREHEHSSEKKANRNKSWMQNPTDYSQFDYSTRLFFSPKKANFPLIYIGINIFLILYLLFANAVKFFPSPRSRHLFLSHTHLTSTFCLKIIAVAPDAAVAITNEGKKGKHTLAHTCW